MLSLISIYIPIQELGIGQGDLPDFFFEMSSRVERHGTKSTGTIWEKIDDVKT